MPLTLAEENVDERVSRFLTRKPSIDDGGDILVIVELFHIDGADGVQDNDRVGAVGGDVLDQSLPSVPQRQVVAVALVAVDGDLDAQARSEEALCPSCAV